MGEIVTIDFRSDTLFAVRRADGVFVALKPIVASLGLDWKAQHRRIMKDAILAEGMAVTAIPSLGGAQETACLRLDLINGWLFTIDETRVRDEDTRRRVLDYKRDCYAVLFRQFYSRVEHGAPGDLIAPVPVAESAEGPKIRMVTEARQTFGCEAAGQLWFRLGLPIVPAMFKDPSQGAFAFPAPRGAGGGA